MKLFFEKSPILFAHRGCSRHFPENTLPAFQAGVDTGVDALEIDVRLTKDDQFVVFHDPDLKRMTGTRGKIRHYTQLELQNIQARHEKAGMAAILPLTDLFAAFPTMNFNIDLKDNEPEAAELLWPLLQQYHMEKQVIIGSFHHNILIHFRKISGGRVVTSASMREVFYWALRHKFHIWNHRPVPFRVLQIPPKMGWLILSSKRFIRTAHRHGIFVHYWTINSPKEMEHLLDCGADGIMSDDPELLVRVYQKWQHQQRGLRNE
ncbi:glycerophosphodiester phosphodiesterase [bacterium]|nr:glycerophosphodiester phosphodiesterase [bacterium]